MKQLILLCQSQADVDALPAAAAVIRAERYDALWFLFSPAVLVDTKAASAQHDRDIADLEAQIARCSQARDWAGCQGYQTQLDAKKLDRVTAVKDAWKTLSKPEQDAAAQSVFGAFFDARPCANIRPEMFRDHYEPAQFIDALNSIRKAWHAPCAPGTFTLTWASNLAGSAGNMNTTAPAPLVTLDIGAISPPTPPAPKAAPAKKEPDPRRRTLMSMNIGQLGDEAIKAGFTPSGSRMKIVNDIIKAEEAKKQPAKAA
jgi:hypothetical protein